MAFAIKIYEKDDYIYQLLRQRLGYLFPEAYIYNPLSDTRTDIQEQFVEFTRTLYDQRQISLDSISDTNPIPLVGEHGSIDCRAIASKLGVLSINPGAVIPIRRPGVLQALLPFVYIEEREQFITENIVPELEASDIPIRLDFISSLRAPASTYSGVSGGNMTGVINSTRSSKFNGRDILKFCERDNNGFFTPGATSGYDDIYDAGTVACLKIITAASGFISDKTNSSSGLCVIEGFRSDELVRLTQDFDKVTVLLPSRLGQDSIGAEGLITNIKRHLTHGSLEVCYCDNISISEEETGYEQAL